MATKRTLSRFSLPDRVAELLREMIVTGELASGERVPVATLAEQLSVSPTPLREALKVLAAEGIVDLLPNRGARVAPYTAEVARHLFEVIVALESHAAELAAGRMTAQDLEGLESLHREMRAFYEASDKESYFRHNSLIHGAIVKGAYNPVLTSTHATLMVRAARGRFIAIADPSRWAESMDEHERLMAALRKRDAPAAASVWRLHLEHTGAATVRALEATVSHQQEVVHG